MQKTYFPKANEIERKCVLVDAEGKILGRMATKIADILRGKNKPTFTPFMDTGDTVIVVNAEKVKVTGNKLKQKEYTKYSGYPSGLKTITLEKMQQKNPAKVIELAVHRMLPKNRLGESLKKHLKVYSGDTHPHEAQQPEKIDI